MQNATGDARFDAIARRLHTQLRDGLASSLREADGAGSTMTVISAPDAAPTTGAEPIDAVQRAAVEARAATAVRTRLLTESGRLVVRAAVIGARNGHETPVAPALQLSSAAAPSELRAFTDALASTVETSLRTTEAPREREQ
jgi:hypothetical protein